MYQIFKHIGISSSRVPYEGNALVRSPKVPKESNYLRNQGFNAVPFLGTHSAPIKETFCRDEALSGRIPTATPIRNAYTQISDEYCSRKLGDDWLGFYCSTNNSVYINLCRRKSTITAIDAGL